MVGIVKTRKNKKKDKNKSSTSKIAPKVTEEGNKGEAKYCFRCGENAHISKDCPKKGELKCSAHPDFSSHTNLACYFYRKANGLPISARHGPGSDRSKDSSQTRTGGTPPAGNGSQNLVRAKEDDGMDST